MIMSLCGGIKTYLPEYQYFPVVSDVFHHCHQWELCCWLHKAQICAFSLPPCASWDKDVLQKRHIYDAYFWKVKVQQVCYTEVSQGQNIQSPAKVPHELYCSRSESGPVLSCPRVVLLQLDKQTFLQAWPNQNGSLLFWMQEFDSASQRWQKFLYFTMKLSRQKEGISLIWFDSLHPVLGVRRKGCWKSKATELAKEVKMALKTQNGNLLSFGIVSVSPDLTGFK